MSTVSLSRTPFSNTRALTDYRELIQLRHFAELSYEEIASMKKLPLGTVKNKLFRARNLLKDALGSFVEPL